MRARARDVFVDRGLVEDDIRRYVRVVCVYACGAQPEKRLQKDRGIDLPRVRELAEFR